MSQLAAVLLQRRGDVMADTDTIARVQAHMATLDMQPCNACGSYVSEPHGATGGGFVGVAPSWAFVDLFAVAAVPTARLLASPEPLPPRVMTVARIVCMHCGFVRDFAWPPRPRELLGRAVKGEQL